MVLVTLEMLLRGFASHGKPCELDDFKKLTHLQLSEKDIDSVDSDIFSACRSLNVLYLYDNKLSVMPSFSPVGCANLTHLYLQNNNISYISGLDALPRLLKLFIGSNRVTVVEGLERCNQLEELHIERQKLPPGHRLVFEPRTIATLAQCLRLLDISGNNCSSLTAFAPLIQIRELISCSNGYEDFRELSGLLEFHWRRLEVLDLSENPICGRTKYRERVILLASDTLVQLDGKEVTSQQRKFVHGWHAAARNREAAKAARHDSASTKSANEHSTGNDSGHSRNRLASVGAAEKSNGNNAFASSTAKAVAQIKRQQKVMQERMVHSRGGGGGGGLGPTSATTDQISSTGNNSGAKNSSYVIPAMPSRTALRMPQKPVPTVPSTTAPLLFAPLTVKKQAAASLLETAISGAPTNGHKNGHHHG